MKLTGRDGSLGLPAASTAIIGVCGVFAVSANVWRPGLQSSSSPPSKLHLALALRSIWNSNHGLLPTIAPSAGRTMVGLVGRRAV